MGRVILHHATLPHRGGAVRVARLLAAAQGRAGHDARLSFELEENDPEAQEGAQPQGIPLSGPASPKELGQIFATLPDKATLHLHTSTDWPALLKGLLPHSEKRRVLLTLHDATPLAGGCAYPLDCPHFQACAEPCPRQFPAANARQTETLGLLRRLAAVARLDIISPSHWLATLARQNLPKEVAVRVIPNGVPWPETTDLTPKAQARQALGIAPSARVALFAAHGGARAAYKSGPRWVEHWRTMRAGLPQALAYAVGGDESFSQDGLTIWPYVDRAKLALLMRAADVLAYPTLADNHPLVLLEAAALELPVVSYSVGGVPEIVLPGRTGLLVSPSGPNGGEGAFCRAVQSLLTDPGLSRRLSKEARAHGARRFTAARMAADHAALLD
jgi:glycosyltransferase involved in cell wall biosynthesis